MSETREIRHKRLRIRSWRRGTREMDLILGPYADGELESLDDLALDAYEALLEQPDPELFSWVLGNGEPGVHLRPTVQRVRRFHRIS